MVAGEIFEPAGTGDIVGEGDQTSRGAKQNLTVAGGGEQAGAEKGFATGQIESVADADKPDAAIGPFLRIAGPTPEGTHPDAPVPVGLDVAHVVGGQRMAVGGIITQVQGPFPLFFKYVESVAIGGYP